LPASSRLLAMVIVGVVGRDDDVLFYNPAQLVAARGMSASFEQLSSTARIGALSSVTRVGSGGIAVGATIANFSSPFGAYPVDRLNMMGAGPNAGTSESFVVGLAQVVKGTRFGLAGKFVDERIANTRNDRALLDLGVAHDFFGTSFGLAVQNIGKSFEPTFPNGVSTDFGTIPQAPALMPLRTTLGAGRGTQAGPFDVYATAAVSLLRDDFVVPAGGGEISYSWLDGYNIILRAGARRPERGEGTFTAGAGFSMDRVSIDYALETLSGSRVANRIGLRIR
jgi:hypothetical protein